MALSTGDFVEVVVRGKMSGQRMDNTLSYATSVGDGTVTLAVWLAAFRAVWRTLVIAKVVDDYEVISYDAQVIGGMTWTEPNNFLKTSWWYREAASIAGAAADVGAIATDPLPSYAAITVRKTCGAVQDPVTFAIRTGEKRFRGGMRIGGIPEADTEPLAPNELVAAIHAAWQAGIMTLDEIISGATRLNMVVLSDVYRGAKRYVNQAVPVASFAYAQVDAMTVSPYISTQLSRKQTVSNLG